MTKQQIINELVSLSSRFEKDSLECESIGTLKRMLEEIAKEINNQ